MWEGRRGAPAPGHSRALGLARSAMLALAVPLLLVACGRGDALPGFEAVPRAAGHVSYDIAIEGLPDEEIAAKAEASLLVYRLRAEGAPSLALLRRRARGDIDTLLRLLRSEGYYAASVEAEVIRPEGADQGAAESTVDTSGGHARVVLRVDPGPPFRLADHRITVTHEGPEAPPALEAKALGSPVGRRARAARIAAAEQAAVALLRRRGFAYARFAGRSGTADPAAATLTVESRIEAGHAWRFGPLVLRGVETIDRNHLASYVPWKPGRLFDEELLAEFQRRLFETELFSAVSVRVPETPPAAPAGEPGGAVLPVIVEANEGPRRRISGSLRYDTDLGPEVSGAFLHRNLFGAGERLLLEARAGLHEQQAGVSLRKPQFLRPSQEGTLSLAGTRTVDDAFDALSFEARAGIERRLGRRRTVGLGGLAELSWVEDAGGKSANQLLGLPAFFAYDGSNDLLNPTKGARARVDLTPFFGLSDAAATGFLVLDARGSYYLPLDRKRRHVLAARGRFGMIPARELADIPANRRLYAGGGGSIRGYALDFVGPLDANNDPVGGRSAIEVGIEYRGRLFGDLGGVVFLDAGSVSTAILPDFADGAQVAAGIGLRYHTSLGPIRLDLAVPLDRRAVDDPFQVYFAIGQAF